MRAVATCALMAIALSACQTPQGVVDTAALVSRMSAQMNGQLAAYVAKQNEIRTDDARRLAEIRARTEHLATANRSQFDLLRLHVAQSAEATRVLDGITTGRIDERAPSGPKSEVAKNTFDEAPLTKLSIAAGAIAHPGSVDEQLKSLGAFGREVYEDMKKANKKDAGR